MEFIECEKIQGVGYCSDNECSCTLTQLSFGGGYVFISPEVVDFRKDALTLAEVKMKLEAHTQAGEYISVSKYAPILVCEIAAQKRNLDMAVAKADAQMYWREGRVPLRSTPWAKADDPLSLSNMFSAIPDDNNPFAHVESKPEDSAPVSENVAVASEPKNPEPPVKSDVEHPMPAPKLSDASVDDVVAQYSSGPLAELAKKMAQGMGGETGVNTPFQEPLPDTVVTKNPKLKPVAQDEDYDNQDYYNSTTGNKKAKKEKVSLTSARKPASSMVLTVLAVVLAVAAIGVLTAIVIVKLQPQKTLKINTTKKPEKIETADPVDPIVPVEKTPVVEVAPQVQNVKRSEIDKTFFEKSYAFEDDNCKGTISFIISDDTSGRYTQLVRLKVNEEKVYTVRGNFTYTSGGIVFRPDSHKKDIQWVLDAYDPQGIVVFHDPSEQNLEKARVSLRVESGGSSSY